MYLKKSNALLLTLDPPCANCKHLTSTGTQDMAGWRCKAFPENSIPYMVLTRRFTHNEVMLDQEGDYVYDPIVYKDDSDPPIDIVFDFDGDLIELADFEGAKSDE